MQDAETMLCKGGRGRGGVDTACEERGRECGAQRDPIRDDSLRCAPDREEIRNITLRIRMNTKAAKTNKIAVDTSSFRSHNS